MPPARAVSLAPKAACANTHGVRVPNMMPRRMSLTSTNPTYSRVRLSRTGALSTSFCASTCPAPPPSSDRDYIRADSQRLMGRAAYKRRTGLLFKNASASPHGALFNKRVAISTRGCFSQTRRHLASCTSARFPEIALSTKRYRKSVLHRHRIRSPNPFGMLKLPLPCRRPPSRSQGEHVRPREAAQIYCLFKGHRNEPC